MTDFTLTNYILRGDMANSLAENTEQLAYVITNVFLNVSIADVIELGELGDEVDDDDRKTEVINNLRALADAIEEGTLT